MTDKLTPHVQFNRDTFVGELFSNVFGAEWEEKTREWNTHGELFGEITHILYGPDEKNHDRWRSESSVSNEVDHLMSFAICLVAGEFLIDAAYGGNMMLEAQQAASISAKRASAQAADIARRVSNTNPKLFRLFQKRLSEFEILFKKATTELDLRITAAGKQNATSDDSK